jgi:hypothetical protein
MKMFFCILFTFFSLSSFSQIQGESEVSLRGDLIEPEFEGGLESFQKVFYAMIKEKKVKRGEVVVASFVIDKNGIMTNIKIIRFNDDESAMSVMETLNKMNDLNLKWKPALRLGEAVPIKLEVPFKF